MRSKNDQSSIIVKVNYVASKMSGCFIGKFWVTTNNPVLFTPETVDNVWSLGCWEGSNNSHSLLRYLWHPDGHTDAK
jgi:hypothetical protein